MKTLRQWIGRIVPIISLVWFLWGMQEQVSVLAAPLAKQTPITVSIELGTGAGELEFVPNHLEFQAGKRYSLMLKNPSPSKHYFTAKDFADAVWSQKVDAGNVEVKGAIHELELRPGTSAEWIFVPVRAGVYNLRCTVAGHTEAGMTGTLEITG